MSLLGKAMLKQIKRSAYVRVRLSCMELLQGRDGKLLFLQ
jgi:hypothetical protein